MHSFWKFVYRFFILPILWGGFHVSGFFNRKVRSGLLGRKGLMRRAQAVRASLAQKPLLLFHCASMGELETLFPLAARLKEKRTAMGVIYFSPSAEKAARKSDHFDFADYTPKDTRRAVRNFLQALKPVALVITKHDVWPNLVWECEQMHIPTFLVNANFSPRSKRFWPIAKSFQKALMGSFQAILTISQEDAERARRILPLDVRLIVTGDSRYDRVMERLSQGARDIQISTESLKERFVLVAGSTHEADEEILLPAVAAVARRHPQFLCLLVPHDPEPPALKRIEANCAQLGLGFLLLSQWQRQRLGQVLCVDRVGILAALYGLGHLAYVGGGFDKGVHSVLEPMGYDLPVLCGPKIEVSDEARSGRAEGVLEIAVTATQIDGWIEKFIRDDDVRRRVGERTRSLVQQRLGAATRIVDFLQKELDLS
ncbi:MAG: glycosyltransferase N-terminal domain-containing protein [bacterium]